MFENEAKGWYGSYSRVGKVYAERFYIISHKEEIFNRENKKIRIKDFFNPDEIKQKSEELESTIKEFQKLDEDFSKMRVKVVEKEGMIHIYKPVTNDLICSHEIPIGQGRVLSTKKAHTDIDAYKISIKRFFGKNDIVDKYFENAIRQQNPMYHVKLYRRIERMTSFYTKEEILEGMKYCIDNGKCSVFELSSFLVYKFGRERARVYLHDMELAHFTKRAKEIEKELTYGRHK